MHRTRLFALALFAIPVAAGAQPAPAGSASGGPVVAVVTLPVPPGTPRPAIVAAFDKAAPLYRQAPGLIEKEFTIGEGTAGGVYVWQSRAAAEAWYASPERQRAAGGAGGSFATVVLYDAPLRIDGTAR